MNRPPIYIISGFVLVMNVIINTFWSKLHFICEQYSIGTIKKFIWENYFKHFIERTNSYEEGRVTVAAYLQKSCVRIPLRELSDLCIFTIFLS